MSNVTSSYQGRSNFTFDLLELLSLVLRFFAFFFNVLSTIILVNPKLENKMYKYLVVISIVDTLYTSLMWFILLVLIGLCGKNIHTDCDPNIYFFVLFLFIFVSDFLTSVLALFGILLEIFLSVHRLILIIDNECHLRHLRVLLVCVIAFVISTLAYTPTLFVNN
jgi:hypothetical protein